MVPLQSGFLLFRLFGLLFAVVGVAFAVAPTKMASRRIVGGDGSTATVEPTGAQTVLMRVLGAVFALVGLSIAVGGPFALF